MSSNLLETPNDYEEIEFNQKTEKSWEEIIPITRDQFDNTIYATKNQRDSCESNPRCDEAATRLKDEATILFQVIFLHFL